MKMGRPQKPHRALNCLLKEDIWHALDEYCHKTGVNKTFVAEKAIAEYLDRCKQQQQLLKEKNLI